MHIKACNMQKVFKHSIYNIYIYTQYTHSPNIVEITLKVLLCFFFGVGSVCRLCSRLCDHEFLCAGFWDCEGNLRLSQPKWPLHQCLLVKIIEHSSIVQIRSVYTIRVVICFGILLKKLWITCCHLIPLAFHGCNDFGLI